MIKVPVGGDGVQVLDNHEIVQGSSEECDVIEGSYERSDLSSLYLSGLAQDQKSLRRHK